MRPRAQDIAVPPFPPATEWVGAAPPPVERLCAGGPLLVHFICAAHLSSVRTLPYLRAWVERYRELGLSVLAVNSPRFPFTGERDKLAAALERLGVGFPVALDSRYEIWHSYGCEGWPSLFLWGRGGALRWFHFGEGEYAATEAAIADELRAGPRPGPVPPEPVPPRRPSDAPGALVVPPTEEVLPGGSVSRPWVADAGDEPLALDYAAAGAWATVDGAGELRVALDGGAERRIAVQAPGAYELASHERHESHRLSLLPSPGVRLYAVGFPAGVPREGARGAPRATSDA